MTQEKLHNLAAPQIDASPTARESWRMFGIMSEFVEATERLAPIRPAVSIFGSARIAPDHPYYQQAEKVARLLSDAGFSVISGGGPGVMEGGQQGRLQGKSAASASTSSCRRSSRATSIRTSRSPSATSSRAR